MSLLAELQTSHWFLALLMFAAMTILYRSQRRVSPNRSAGRLDNSTAKSAAAAAKAAASPAERTQWETDLHDFARDVTARIDSKLAALEHLLRAAHHETLRLEAAIAQANQCAEIAVHQPAHATVEPLSASHQAHRLEEIRRQHQSLPHISDGKPPVTDRSYARIYALADSQSGVQDIAAQVGRPVGEVELILSLRQQT